jgi:hypothetical protein
MLSAAKHLWRDREWLDAHDFVLKHCHAERSEASVV